ncbi:hypothetical protein K1T71_005284 [Dendrolimus kikuchii]|uniref:Uncharacterized protein n=1 Tax=Dendrolimus kikuchii TaxID=765133 RepID=A0ACC1D841_9NEOP|nr:hypothetical protein K1T71_005284 [Dendrolimus kikuchii]
MREHNSRLLWCHTLDQGTVSSIYAIQDQAVNTKQHQRDILKAPVDGKCRLCVTKDESAQHIISGCEKLAGTYYVNRHNNLVQYIYWCLARKHNIDVSPLWWHENMVQPQIKENNQAKILWEMPVQTDITVRHNRPDLIYIDKTNNKTFLIDITVPSDYNIGGKEIEKLSKYHLLKTEVSRLWNTQATVVPIVVGATGIVAKSINKYIEKLDASIDITILQKQAALHTTNILRKVLGDTVFVNNAHTLNSTTQNTTQQPEHISQSPHTLDRSDIHTLATQTQTVRGRTRGRRRRDTHTDTIQSQ